jgi:hypothetical protein
VVSVIPIATRIATPPKAQVSATPLGGVNTGDHRSN